MKAITVIPGQPDQARVTDIDAPPEQSGSILVEGLLLGICGTDHDIIEGQDYGWLPPNRQRMVIGHESLGRVRQAPPGTGFAPGDLVVGMVRRPDPVPCEPCARGEADFCRNGRYTERGIKELDGFGSQLWRTDPQYAIKLDPALGDCGVLLEPASVLAKAWDHTDRIFSRASWRPKVALVTGAGPIGLFAALMGVQRGLEVHVLDLDDRGPKARLVTDLGATFHTGSLNDLGVTPDVVIECTGHGPLVIEATQVVAACAVICMTGIAAGARRANININDVNNDMVLKNIVAFGSVNAARRHFEQGADALAGADPAWLRRIITRRVPMDDFRDGLSKHEDDVKVVVDLQA